MRCYSRIVIPVAGVLYTFLSSDALPYSGITPNVFCLALSLFQIYARCQSRDVPFKFYARVTLTTI